MALNNTEDITDANSENVRKLLLYGTLCSDGSVVFEDGIEKHLGDPTETSIVYAAHRNGMEKEEVQKCYPRLSGIPFDSDRKYQKFQPVKNWNVTLPSWVW